MGESLSELKCDKSTSLLDQRQMALVFGKATFLAFTGRWKSLELCPMDYGTVRKQLKHIIQIIHAGDSL